METIIQQLSKSKDALSAIKGGNGSELSLKAAGTMLLANITGLTSTHVDAQLMPAIPIANSYAQSCLDYFPIIPCSSHALVIVNQESDDSDGTFSSVAEGAAKEQVDFDLRATPKAFTKYAAYIKVSQEMIDDIDYMDAVIRSSLTRRIKDKIATDYLAAIVAATGVLSSAITGGTNATVALECLPPIYSGMRLLKGYNMNLFLLNDPDYSKMYSMAGTGFSQNTSFLTTMPINIEPCAAVTTGNIHALDTSMFPLYVYKDATVTVGTETADFINNLVTVKAEARVAWNVAGECLNAYFKDSLSNAITRF